MHGNETIRKGIYKISKDRGSNISIQYLYKLKKSIKESRFDRLNLIAKSQFIDQHLERIDQMELVNQEMWSKYIERITR